MDTTVGYNSSLENVSVPMPQSYPGKPVDMDALTIVYLMTYGTIATVGLLGNVLVIVVISKYTSMKTVTNMYILNLSIADTLFLIGLPLTMATVALKHWIFGFALCKLYYITTCINMFTGTFTLTVMSGDRFLAVCYPIQSRSYRTPKYASMAITLIWILSFIFMLPVVLYTQIIPSPKLVGKHSCTIIWPTQGEMTGSNIFITYTMILGFVIPVVLISLLYTLLVIRLRTTGPRCRDVKRKQSNRKVTRLVSLIITIYIICWLPYWVFQVFLLTITHQLPPWLVYIYHGFTLLSYSNSMMNPMLYAFTNENFRQAFISAFKCISDPGQGHNHDNHHHHPTTDRLLTASEPVSGKMKENYFPITEASKTMATFCDDNGLILEGTDTHSTQTSCVTNGEIMPADVADSCKDEAM